jgi:hypothetical protein
MKVYAIAGKNIIGFGILVFVLLLGGCAHSLQFVPQPSGPECSTNVARIYFAMESDARDWMVSNFGLTCPYSLNCNGKNIAVMKNGSYVVWDQPVSSEDKNVQIAVRYMSGGLKDYKYTLPVEAGRVSRLILKFGLTRASFRELSATEWEKICAGYSTDTCDSNSQ